MSWLESSNDRGDAASYTITAGNDVGKSVIVGSTRHVAVVDPSTVPSYTLMVQASDLSDASVLPW